MRMFIFTVVLLLSGCSSESNPIGQKIKFGDSRSISTRSEKAHPGEDQEDRVVSPVPLERSLATGMTIDGDDHRLDLNGATAGDLQQLPGIGPVLSQRILEYRKRHGAFRSATELLNVWGVGSKTFHGLENLVRVSATTTPLRE